MEKVLAQLVSQCTSHMIFFVVMHLTDPTPSSDGHYKPFAEIFGKETSENHRLSLQKKPKKDDSSIPRCITTCQECKHDVGMRRCGMWCLLYVKNKLTVGEITALQQVLDIWSFTCAVQLQDLNITGHLADVYVIKISSYYLFLLLL